LRPEDFSLHFDNGLHRADGDSLEEVELAHIRQVLDDQHWNITRTAEVLGINRVTLYNKIKKYGLRKD
jgi:transcriptional regulator of acetoin/glycerol metabolism